MAIETIARQDRRHTPVEAGRGLRRGRGRRGQSNQQCDERGPARGSHGGVGGWWLRGEQPRQYTQNSGLRGSPSAPPRPDSSGIHHVVGNGSLASRQLKKSSAPRYVNAAGPVLSAKRSIGQSIARAIANHKFPTGVPFAARRWWFVFIAPCPPPAITIGKSE